MIGYVTLGTNDLERATVFYDSVLSEIGAKRLDETDRYVFWGKRSGPGMLALFKPYDAKPATVGNGAMVALGVRTRDQVERLYQVALSLGASDEGAPGNRGANFYGAYFRDLDDNKLCVFTFETPPPEG
jgi:catechol 2,3-dioxygenase-like lactoylglutathione lyase family enzyme